jgi:Sulfotransferase family
MTRRAANGTGALRDPIVVVGGAQRSGTTLFRNMLTAHPDLAVPDESPFVTTIWDRLVRRRRQDDVELAWRLIRENARFRQWQLDPRHVEPLLAERPPRSYADLVRVLFAAYATSRGKPHAGDKTTGNALRFEWLASLFPRSRFIHVLRDPREVCMSLSVQPWHRGGIAEAAWEWMNDVRRARRAVVGLSSRYLEVRYEDLVRQPEAELRRLCSWAELPFAREMLDYADSEHVLLDAHHTHSRGDLRPDLRRWERELAPADVALVEHMTGGLMEEVGYACVTDWPPMRVRLAARRQRLRRRSRRRRDQWLRSRAPRLGAALHAVARGSAGRP